MAPYRLASLLALAIARERTGFRIRWAPWADALDSREVAAAEWLSVSLTNRICRDATSPAVRLVAIDAIADQPAKVCLYTLALNCRFSCTQLNAAACNDSVAAATFSVPINANSRRLRAPDESRVHIAGLVR